jgi:hypothetical protein
LVWQKVLRGNASDLAAAGCIAVRFPASIALMQQFHRSKPGLGRVSARYPFEEPGEEGHLVPF